RVLDNLAVNHTRAANLEVAFVAAGAAAGAPAKPALNRYFCARLDERKVVAAKTHTAVSPEQCLTELGQSALHVAHRQPFIDRQQLDLGDHPFVGGVRRLIPVYVTRRGKADRRLMPFHETDL